MSAFTELERAVLFKICGQYPLQRAQLEKQLRTATVLSRKNTGAGFYTHFEVNRSTSPSVTCNRIIGDAWAAIDGFEAPMTFLLMVEDGYMNCLEGASMGDSTTNTDLSAIGFEILAA